MVEIEEADLTTMAFLLRHLKLYSAIELSGDEPISNGHHHSRYNKENQQQQDAPEDDRIQRSISAERSLK